LDNDPPLGTNGLSSPARPLKLQFCTSQTEAWQSEIVAYWGTARAWSERDQAAAGKAKHQTESRQTRQRPWQAQGTTRS